VPAILVVAVLGIAIVGLKVASSALAARDALQNAMPLAGVAKQQILQGDVAAAGATVDTLSGYTSEARVAARGRLWSLAELVPFLGPNLAAVCTVATEVDELTTQAAQPFASLDLSGLTSEDGRIDVAKIQDMAGVVDHAATVVAGAQTALAGLD